MPSIYSLALVCIFFMLAVRAVEQQPFKEKENYQQKEPDQAPPKSTSSRQGDRDRAPGVSEPNSHNSSGQNTLTSHAPAATYPSNDSHLNRHPEYIPPLDPANILRILNEGRGSRREPDMLGMLNADPAVESPRPQPVSVPEQVESTGGESTSTAARPSASVTGSLTYREVFVEGRTYPCPSDTPSSGSASSNQTMNQTHLTGYHPMVRHPEMLRVLNLPPPIDSPRPQRAPAPNDGNSAQRNQDRNQSGNARSSLPPSGSPASTAISASASRVSRRAAAIETGVLFEPALYVYPGRSL